MIFVISSGADAETTVKILQKKLQKEGSYKWIRSKRHHETHSQKRARKAKEAFRRRKKANKKSFSANSNPKSITLFLTKDGNHMY